jgi:hypothetical protein
MVRIHPELSHGIPLLERGSVLQGAISWAGAEPEWQHLVPDRECPAPTSLSSTPISTKQGMKASPAIGWRAHGVEEASTGGLVLGAAVIPAETDREQTQLVDRLREAVNRTGSKRPLHWRDLRNDHSKERRAMDLVSAAPLTRPWPPRSAPSDQSVRSRAAGVVGSARPAPRRPVTEAVNAPPGAEQPPRAREIRHLPRARGGARKRSSRAPRSRRRPRVAPPEPPGRGWGRFVHLTRILPRERSGTCWRQVKVARASGSVGKRPISRVL